MLMFLKIFVKVFYVNWFIDWKMWEVNCVCYLNMLFVLKWYILLEKERILFIYLIRMNCIVRFINIFELFI